MSATSRRQLATRVHFKPSHLHHHLEWRRNDSDLELALSKRLNVVVVVVVDLTLPNGVLTKWVTNHASSGCNLALRLGLI